MESSMLFSSLVGRLKLLFKMADAGLSAERACGLAIMRVLVFIFVLSSCSEQADSTLKIQEKPNVNIGIKNTFLQGRWVMCAGSDGENMMLHNMCKDIFFSNSGSGYAKTGNSMAEFFDWSLAHDTLSIRYKYNIQGSTFADSLYLIKLESRDDGKRLNLSCLDRNCMLFLSAQ